MKLDYALRKFLIVLVEVRKEKRGKNGEVLVRLRLG